MGEGKGNTPLVLVASLLALVAAALMGIAQAKTAAGAAVPSEGAVVIPASPPGRPHTLSRRPSGTSSMASAVYAQTSPADDAARPASEAEASSTPAPDAKAAKAEQEGGPAAPKAHNASTAKKENALLPKDSPFAGLAVGNSRSPINIKSDSLSLDHEARSAQFIGHVRAVQEGAELTSNTLTVLYGGDFRDLKQLIADGDVRISQGTRWVTGDRAVLDETRHTAVLTGSPVVHDGSDQITGTRITVYLDTGKSVVEGARAVIFPKRLQAPDNVSGTREAQ